MFCSHCGNQVPDGSKFCAHCGAQTQAAAPQAAPQQPYTPPQHTQPIYTAPQQPIAAAAPKTEKKKTPIWVSIAIGLAAFGIASFIIAPAISGGNNKPDDGSLQNNSISNNAGSSGENSSLNLPNTSSSEYNEIFSGHNIVTSPAFLRSSKTAAFAYIDSTGMIEKMEFGYEGDIIHEFIDTIYIPLSGTGQTAQELESSLRNTFGSYESLSFCTVSYSAGTQYYTVTISLKDLDEAENVQLVGDLIDISGDGLISFSQTERSLLARGFVKR